MQDICLPLSQYIFNYRVAAIIKHQNHKDAFESSVDGGTFFKWHEIKDLTAINFQPHFLRNKLEVLPESLEHIMSKETI